MIDMLQAELLTEGEARLRRLDGGQEIHGFFLRPPRRGESLMLWEARGFGAVKTSPVVRVLALGGSRALYVTTESGSRYRWEPREASSMAGAGRWASS